MLRMATIASLVVLNVAVWLGPAESLLARSGDDYAATVLLQRADDLLVEGDHVGALHILQQLVESYPDNAAYRFELGTFQHMHADFISQQENISLTSLARSAQEQMRRGRDLAPDDAQLASNYAVMLMDTDFFGEVVAREELLDAWEQVRRHATARQASESEWHFYADSIANVLLQKARVEARFGNVEAARALVEEARSYSPRLHVPKSFIEHNQEPLIQ